MSDLVKVFGIISLLLTASLIGAIVGMVFGALFIPLNLLYKKQVSFKGITTIFTGSGNIDQI